MCKSILKYAAIVIVALIIGNCSHENSVLPTQATAKDPQMLSAATYIPPAVSMQGEVCQVIRKNDNVPLVFARGTNNLLYYSDSKASVVSYNPIWTQIAGSATISGNIVAMSKTNGEIWVFSKNSSNIVVWSKCPVGGAFSTWALLSGLTTTATSEVAAGLNVDGTIDVFAKNASGNTLSRMRQNADGTWPTSWFQMASGIIGDNIAVGVSCFAPSGRLQVFCKNSSNALLTFFEQAANGSWTSAFSNLGGGTTRNISVVTNHQPNLEVYGMYNNQLYRRVQTSMTAWSAWELLPMSSTLFTQTVVKNPDGRLEVFYIAANKVVHTWQVNAGIWTGCLSSNFGQTNPDLLRGPAASYSAISVILHPVKNVFMVFSLGQSSSSNNAQELHSVYQDWLMPTAWSPWVLALRPYDLDGNEYSAVKIGTQIWMAQNLKTTKYNDGTAILNVTDQTAWNALTTPAYCWYNNDISYKEPYGALYNGYTTNTGKLAIEGWKVPTRDEWNAFASYISGTPCYTMTSVDIVGGKLKEAGNVHWSWSSAGLNTYGFTALPGGWRDRNSFKGLTTDAKIWSSTTITPITYCQYLKYNDNILCLNWVLDTPFGCSVRLCRQ